MNNLADSAKKATQKAKDHAPKTEKWVEHFARFGYATKGTVYLLIGILATLAAFGAGGKVSGKQGVFREIIQQPYGKILLGVMAIGFVGFMSWRFIQAFKDAENRGDDAKGILFRTGFVISGLVYGFFAYYALTLMTGSSQGKEAGQKFIIDQLLEQPAGQWVVALLALIALAKGFYQFYQGVTHTFSQDVRDHHVKREVKQTYNTAGKWGYMARGMVFVIFGYFLMEAALTANPSQAGGTGSVFSFLQATGGPWLMGLIAIGLAGYGAFQWVKATYKPFNTA